jgi:parafibromin
MYRGKDSEDPVEYYTLESLLFLLKNVKLPHPLYVTRASGQNVPVVRMPDRRELLQYLNGEIESTASINRSAPLEVPQQPPPVKRPQMESGSDAKRPRIEPRLMDKLDSQKSGLSMQDQLNKSSTIIGAIPLEKIAQIKEKVRARQRAVMKPSDDDIKADGVRGITGDTMDDFISREKQHRTRTTVLQSAGKSFDNLLSLLQSVKAREEGKVPEVKRTAPVKEQQVRSQKPAVLTQYSRYDQERFKSTQDTLGFKIDTTSTHLSLKSATDLPQKPVSPLSVQNAKNDTTAANPLGKSPRSKKESRVPIIIIPSAPTSNITMWNARDFLQDFRFVPSADKKKVGNKKESEFVVIRKKPDPTHGGSVSIPYLIMDNPTKLHPQDWKRVVAVFVAGQSWQFKGWPGLTSDGSPVNIFAKIKAFHLKFEEAVLEPNIHKWDVQILTVSKLKRHLDKVAGMKFWEMLDKVLVKNFQHLRF